MEIFRFNILPLKEILKKEWIHNHSHCSQCSSELRLSHEMLLAEADYIQEVAHCPSCQTQVRKELYQLQ